MKALTKTVIGNADAPLMIRYVLFRCAAWGIYLHQFRRSDHDRALHDHPWPYVAVILRGGYTEEHDQTIDGNHTRELRSPGDVLVRPAEWRHRVILPEGRTSWSLIIVGRRQRRWGFFCSDGWCHWKQYDQAKGICEDQPIHVGGED